MTKMSCSDYGFECDFAVEDEDVQAVVERFGKHTSKEHGIEYAKEVLMQFIIRQKRPWAEAEAYP
jgi:predicted small metal-binding protein